MDHGQCLDSLLTKDLDGLIFVIGGSKNQSIFFPEAFCIFCRFFFWLHITKIASFSSQAAVEEGIVVGGGCTLLRLAAKVDAIKDTLENDEQKVKT